MKKSVSSIRRFFDKEIRDKRHRTKNHWKKDILLPLDKFHRLLYLNKHKMRKLIAIAIILTIIVVNSGRTCQMACLSGAHAAQCKSHMTKGHEGSGMDICQVSHSAASDEKEHDDHNKVSHSKQGASIKCGCQADKDDSTGSVMSFTTLPSSITPLLATASMIQPDHNFFKNHDSIPLDSPPETLA